MNDGMIPYFVMEGVVDRQSHTIKKLWILCIILIVLLVGTNVAWLYYESQFEEVTTTQKVEQEVETEDGDVNLIGIGNNYGESKAISTNND